MLIASGKHILKTLFAASLAAVVALGCAVWAVPSRAWALEEGATATVTVDGVAAGDTVELYRFIDVSYDATTNVVNRSFANGIDIDGDGDSDEADIEAYAAQADDASTLAQTLGSIAASVRSGDAASAYSVTASGTSATLTDVSMGSYLVAVTPGSGSSGCVYQLTVANVVPEVVDGTYTLPDLSITTKKTEVTLDKGIGSLSVKDSDAYGGGSTVPYVVAFTVPSYPADATNTTLEVSDAMDDALTFDASSLTVSVGDEELDSSAYKLESATHGFTLTFDYGAVSTYASQTVTLRYGAQVASDAVPGTDYENHATLSYAPDPYSSTVSKLTSETTVKTYGLYLHKVEKGDTSKGLSGAEFAVYRGDEEGSATLDQDADSSTPEVAVTDLGTITSDDEGWAKLEGLGSGVYYLKETKAPDGYQLTGTVFTVTVSASTVDTADDASAFGSSAASVDTTGYLNCGDIENPKKGSTPAQKGSNPAQKVADKMPKTGDPLWWAGVALMVAAAGVVVIVAARKRREG